MTRGIRWTIARMPPLARPPPTGTLMIWRQTVCQPSPQKHVFCFKPREQSWKLSTCDFPPVPFVLPFPDKTFTGNIRHTSFCQNEDAPEPTLPPASFKHVCTHDHMQLCIGIDTQTWLYSVLKRILPVRNCTLLFSDQTKREMSHNQNPGR